MVLSITEFNLADILGLGYNYEILCTFFNNSEKSSINRNIYSSYHKMQLHFLLRKFN